MSLKEKMTALADAVRHKANRSDTLTIDAMTAAVNGLVVGTPSTQTLTVNPTKEQQTFSSSDLGENTYYSTVTVNAIPSEYVITNDATAAYEDILEGKTAYVNGVKVTGRMKEYDDFQTILTPSKPYATSGPGHYQLVTVQVESTTADFTPSKEFQYFEGNKEGLFLSSVTVAPIPAEYIVVTKKSLEVTPSYSTQVFNAINEGSDVFYDKVTVASIPAEYINTADATATEGTIIEGKTAYVKGEKVTGTYIELSEDDVRVGARFGANNTFGGEKIGRFTLDATAEPTDILPGKTAYVLGVKVTGMMPVKAAETYTPGTADITIPADTYLSGAQTIKGDNDLTAGNIRTGVSIFNVEGTFTADATAISSDIAGGKTAYVKGEKIVGTATGASGYNQRTTVSNQHMVQVLGKAAQIPTPSNRQGCFSLNNDIVYYINNGIYRELTPIGNITYLVGGCWPNDSRGYGISDGKVYHFWYDSQRINEKWVYGVFSRLVTPDLSNVSELVITNGDRFLCREGETLYAGHSDGSNVIPVSGVSAGRILNYDASSKATVITTSGDIARVEWWEEEPYSYISESDRGNGNPFTNVNYQASDEYGYDGASYMLAFRETGFWYKEVSWEDRQWVQASGVPDLIKTNWLGRCVTSREETYSYDEETGEENWGYIIKQSEVALHIDTSGRLWKISAKCTEDGTPDGIAFTQVGTDSDWTYVHPSISSNRSVNNNTFAQKGGKLIRLITDTAPDMGITWEEYAFSPDGKLISTQDGNYLFSLKDVVIDYTRAGGMI